MGRWSREELEVEFERYQERALRAGSTGEWDQWADQFTEDATYVEHLFGEFCGREAIRRWITETMSTYPGSDMPHYPVEWYIIDEERGWVVCQVWNRMADPGDGGVFQAYNFTLLKYAGDGLWKYEEDVYNPAHFASMLESYGERKATLAAENDERSG